MLVDCPECSGRVSDSAEICPHCGYRLHGREHLVHCPTCETDVIPVRRSDDIAARFCPLCNRTLTHPFLRFVAIAVAVAFAVFVLSEMISSP